MEIKLIVFDLAGTNVHDDDNVHHALINTMKQIGIILTIDEVNEK